MSDELLAFPIDLRETRVLAVSEKIGMARKITYLCTG